jgi:hypothetical protein
MTASMLDNPFLAGALGGDPDDTERNPDPPADEPIRTGVEHPCQECGEEVEYSGRGARSPFCKKHRRTRTRSTAARPEPVAGSSAADRALKARLDAIVGDLEEGAGALAGTIAPVAPVTSGTILLTAHEGIIGLVRIAADHPRMLDGLEAAAKGVPFLAVGKFVAGLFLAVAVDMGRLAPIGLAAEYLRVAEAAEKVGWQPPQSTMDAQPPPDGGVDWTVPPPPRFTFK